MVWTGNTSRLEDAQSLAVPIASSGLRSFAIIGFGPVHLGLHGRVEKLSGKKVKYADLFQGRKETTATMLEVTVSEGYFLVIFGLHILGLDIGSFSAAW